MASNLTVIFDLDGTLTDSKPGILHCLGTALEATGIVWNGPLDWFIGPPVEVSLEHLMPDGDESAREALLRRYRTCYDQTGWAENSVYAGIPELLETLQKRGAKLFVCTSKRKKFALRVLQHFDLDKYFVAVYSDHGDKPHSKVELLAELLDEQKVDRAEAYMVGDRQFDIEAANANGIRGVAVSYGYGSPEELAGAHPAAICNTAAEVLAFLPAGSQPGKQAGGRADPAWR